MKKILVISTIFIGVQLMSSCENKLELVDPNNVGDAVALATENNIRTTLVGAYDALSAGALFGGNTLRNSELLGANDDIRFTGTFNDPADLYRKQQIALNSDAAATWINAYRTINVANNILSALDVVSQGNRDEIEGEALFLRAICYFEMIQFFAQPYSAGNVASNPGVPLMLVEDRNSVEPKQRSSVAQVYAQIIADLTNAESKLGVTRRANRATKGAAAALLSRVYLQMEEFQNARDAANRVIASNQYSLVSPYSSIFNSGSTNEDIFDIPVSTVDGINNMYTFYSSSFFGGRADIDILPKFLNQYDPLDQRRQYYYIDPVNEDRVRTGKWRDRFSNVKLIRLAEMYLTRAECNQRLGTSIGNTPLDDINIIRTRAGLTPLITVDLNSIIQERFLELAHEGHKLHDIKRLRRTVVEGTNNYTFDHPLLVFPIPQRDININPDLGQNPGYN